LPGDSRKRDLVGVGADLRTDPVRTWFTRSGLVRARKHLRTFRTRTQLHGARDQGIRIAENYLVFIEIRVGAESRAAYRDAVCVILRVGQRSVWDDGVDPGLRRDQPDWDCSRDGRRRLATVGGWVGIGSSLLELQGVTSEGEISRYDKLYHSSFCAHVGRF